MYTKLDILSFTHTGTFVSQELFGGNTVYSRNTADGTPGAQYTSAIKNLGISNLRYPAGQVNTTYSDGLLVNGGLPQHLVKFMEWAVQNGVKVVIVTPTIEDQFDAGELRKFAKLLVSAYGDHIEAFEIGNEFWSHMTETEYGKIANDSVLAIDRALRDIDSDIDIWVQMADASGVASEYKGEDGGWVSRTLKANLAIISQLSDQAKEIIDGAVEHYYYKRDNQYLDYAADPTNLIDLDIATWRGYLGQDLSLNITEWNIQSSNLYQLGMRSASLMVAQFSYMLEMKVDTAYVWPPQHNTTNDLAGSGHVITDTETGLVVNSVGGAIYNLMSDNLVGLEFVRASTRNANSRIETHVFADDERAVVYVASRSDAVEDVSFSLDVVAPNARLTSAMLVGYDKSTSNGMHYSSKHKGQVASDFVLVNGEEYHLNEHDVQASISSLQTYVPGGAGSFEFSLNPFEVVQLTYVLTPREVIHGTSRADKIDGSIADEFIFGGYGSDTISGNGGDDKLMGSGGADDLNGGSGNDELHGGAGQDRLIGGSGNDVLVAEAVDLLIDGGPGSDVVDFSSSATRVDIDATSIYSDIGIGVVRDVETFFGTDFDDVVSFVPGDVEIHGGDGDDVIRGNGIAGCTVYGDAGNDAITMASGTIAYGGDGNDTISSAEGDEKIFSGSGDDLIIVRSGKDEITSGSGRDTIWINSWSDSTHVMVRDFDLKSDTILLFGHLNLRDGSSYREYATQENTTLKIQFDTTWIVELEGVQMADFFL
jgi:Ca2+-binding RTX toxin-like protein